MVIEKPRLAQDARVLGLGDVVVLDSQFHVVAHAPAKSAGGVFDDLEGGGHAFFCLCLSFTWKFNPKVFADTSARGCLDFSMPRNFRFRAGGGISYDGMSPAFSNNYASVT